MSHSPRAGGAGSKEPAGAERQGFYLHPVHLEGFDGPLDLLLFLVKENQKDISEISIATVADQYLEFIYLMPLLTPPELENAAEFLSVAAILAWLKSKSLLPVQQEEDDGESAAADAADAEDLLRRLREYEQFTAPADWLWNRFSRFKLMFPRGVSELATPDLDLGEISLFDLASAFAELLEKAEPEPPTEISPLRVNVQETMKEVLRLLRQSRNPLALAQLVGEKPTRVTILACFLALLELIKSRKVKVFQSSPYGPITVALFGSPKASSSESGGE